MKSNLWCFLVCWVCFPSAGVGDLFDLGESSFEIEFLNIGSPGNASNILVERDVELGTAEVSIGGVPYDYRMAKYELPFEVLHLANEFGSLEIEIEEEPAGPEFPINRLTWFSFARLTNWLNEVQGYSHAYKFSFQPGDERYSASDLVLEWSPEDPGYDPKNRIRNSRAKYVLPTSEEWYKAAFFDPERDAYFPYVGSDSPLTAVTGGTLPGTAVFEADGPAEVMNAGGPNQFGLVGMAGNLFEWSEAAFDFIPDFPEQQSREIWGRDFTDSPEQGTATSVSAWPQDLAPSHIGIRIAAVPEPNCSFLAALASLGCLGFRRRKRSSSPLA